MGMTSDIVYALCLGCGQYLPRGHKLEAAWLEQHVHVVGDDTSVSKFLCREITPNGRVFFTTHPESAGAEGWVTTPVLSELEVFAWAASREMN